MSVLIETSQKAQFGTWIEIRLSRLLHNLKALKERAGNPQQVLAVIKANAYGHGLLEIARALAGEVVFLGVSSLREALELKEHGIPARVFIFGRLLSQELPAALMDGFTLSVSGFDEAREISELSLSLSRKTPVHVKIDTGMGRLGIPFKQAVPAVEKIRALEGIHLEGIYTHFPIAERNDSFTQHQLDDFTVLIKFLEEKGITFTYHHAANSAGSVRVQNPVLNLMRPGLMLYGIYPDASLTSAIRILPAMSLKSRIVSLKRLQPGDSAGYGRDFVATRPVTIAVLPIGYSHGYPFSASGKAQVLYRGKRYSLAGRVSMDYLTVDLGDTLAQPGDEVTLIGEDQTEKIMAEDLAAWARTIPYEIVTRLLPSIPRLYQ